MVGVLLNPSPGGQAREPEAMVKAVRIWGFSEFRGTISGVLIIRIIVYWGLHWDPPTLGNYHVDEKGLGFRAHGSGFQGV